MFRKLFLFLVLLLMYSPFTACFESSDDPENADDLEDTSVVSDTLSDVVALTGRGPVVNLVNEGIVLKGIRRWNDETFVDLFARFSLEVNQPLDHNLLILVDRIGYEKNENILIEADEVESWNSFLMCIIEKGDTKSGIYRDSVSLPGISTLETQLLAAKEREAAYTGDREPVPIMFTFGRAEGEVGVIRRDPIPHDYKFNPYRIGSPNKFVLNLVEEFDKFVEEFDK